MSFLSVELATSVEYYLVMASRLRLDAGTERLVIHLATKLGCSRSEVLREAILLLAESETAASSTGTPYDKIVDLIGCASRGAVDSSARTGERFSELLRKRH